MRAVHDIDLNLLRALDALLETRSVSGAAARLHLSQPAMSRALNRIRRVVDDPVLVRSGHTMQATPWAEHVQDEVRELLHRNQAVFTGARTLDLARLDRTFTVMANDANVTTIGSELLVRARAAAPGIRIRFLSEAPDLHEALRDGSADLHISTADRAAAPAGVHVQPLGGDRHVAVVRAGHPLGAEPLCLTEFVAAPQIVASRRGRLTGPIDDALAAMGLSRRVVASAPTFAAMLVMLTRDDLLGTVPQAAHGPTAAALGLRLLPLPLEVPPVAFAQFWHARQHRDPAHAWLRGLVLEISRGTWSDT